jgi:hypothetical protein
MAGMDGCINAWSRCAPASGAVTAVTARATAGRGPGVLPRGRRHDPAERPRAHRGPQLQGARSHCSQAAAKGLRARAGAGAARWQGEAAWLLSRLLPSLQARMSGEWRQLLLRSAGTQLCTGLRHQPVRRVHSWRHRHAAQATQGQCTVACPARRPQPARRSLQARSGNRDDEATQHPSLPAHSRHAPCSLPHRRPWPSAACPRPCPARATCC